MSNFGSGHDLVVHESSPASGSVLTARSLEPASDSVSPSLSDPPPIHVLSLSVSKINKRLKKFFKNVLILRLWR